MFLMLVNMYLHGVTSNHLAFTRLECSICMIAVNIGELVWVQSISSFVESKVNSQPVQNQTYI